MTDKRITLHPLRKDGSINTDINLYPKTKYNQVIGLGDFLSVERLGDYIFKATFDSIPDYKEITWPVGGGCTSFVRDGKLYRNLDWFYDETATFWIKCKDFEGVGFINGVTDGNLDRELIGQLPYHIVDGCNKDHIRISTHILFNDFNFNGSGRKDKSITQLPIYIMQNLHSINDINTVLSDYLANIKIPDALKAMGYLIQYLVTDGTTTYAILPSESGYTLQDITSNPKLANFKWVNNATVNRSDLQLRPTGVERWNEIGAVSSSAISLEDLRFTIAYDENHPRLSEFIGEDGTTKNSTDADLIVQFNKVPSHRVRGDKTWQTVHSVIYGPNGIEHLWVQENYEKDYISSSTVDSSFNPNLYTRHFIINQNTPTEIIGMDVSVPNLTYAQCYDLVEQFLNGRDCFVTCISLGVMKVIAANGNETTGNGWLTIELFQNDINYLVTYKAVNNSVNIVASDCPTKSFVLTGMSGYFENDEEHFLQLHNNIIIDWSNPDNTPYYGPHHYLRKVKDTTNQSEFVYENSEIRCIINLDNGSWRIEQNGVFKHKLMIWKNEYNSALGIYLEIIDGNPSQINSLSRIPEGGVVPCKNRTSGIYAQSVLYRVGHNSSYDELYVKETADASPTYWTTADLVFNDTVEKL